MQGLGGGGEDLGDVGPLFDGDDQEGDLVPVSAATLGLGWLLSRL